MTNNTLKKRMKLFTSIICLVIFVSGNSVHSADDIASLEKWCVPTQSNTSDVIAVLYNIDKFELYDKRCDSNIKNSIRDASKKIAQVKTYYQTELKKCYSATDINKVNAAIRKLSESMIGVGSSGACEFYLKNDARNFLNMIESAF